MVRIHCIVPLLPGMLLALSGCATTDSNEPLANPQPTCSATTEAAPAHHSDLPSGACGGESCVVYTQDLCEGSNAVGPVMRYDCNCANGAWSCDGTALSKAVCPSPQCPQSSEDQPISATGLPMGSCAEGFSCSVFTQDRCPDGVAEGPYLRWDCACDDNGQWHCDSTALSKAVCP